MDQLGWAEGSRLVLSLKKALSIPSSNSIWILSDSHSALQNLSNWHYVSDNTEVAILEKLKRLASYREIHLQRVPSHVNITGNEIADALAKYGAAQYTRSLSPIQNGTPTVSTTNNQLILLIITDMRLNTMVILFSLQCSRQEQTILTRFRSGHLQVLTFKNEN
ncbi:RNase H domain-containing protein [Trichonephila clavipes]|nr:RNase H domain-containing protein [Trichonephila clavipes]